MIDYLKNIWEFINDNATAIGFFTLIAIFITAISTCLNVVSQKQQFAYTNRAKVELKYNGIIGDSVKGAKTILTNYGNLPAENFRLSWEVFNLSSNSKIKPNKGHIKRHEIVFPDQDIEVTCDSKFKDIERSIILIVAYQYECKDLEYIRKRDFYGLWVPEPKIGKQSWALLPKLVNPTHMKIIDENKERLRQFLEKEN